MKSTGKVMVQGGGTFGTFMSVSVDVYKVSWLIPKYKKF